MLPSHAPLSRSTGNGCTWNRYKYQSSIYSSFCRDIVPLLWTRDVPIGTIVLATAPRCSRTPRDQSGVYGRHWQLRQRYICDWSKRATQRAFRSLARMPGDGSPNLFESQIPMQCVPCAWNASPCTKHNLMCLMKRFISVLPEVAMLTNSWPWRCSQRRHTGSIGTPWE